MNRTSTAAVALLGGAICLALASGARAQEGETIPGSTAFPTPPEAPTSPGQRPEALGAGFLQRGMKVTDRPRPELEPLGVHLGTFFLYPRLELDEVYNDNIFATESNTSDDFITVLSPTLDLKSNWAVHSVELKAGASVGRYLDHSSEDYADYFASAEGRYDINRYLAGFGGVRYEHLHEERDSPDIPATAAEPVEFDAYNLNAGIAQRGLRIGYRAEVGLRREDYSDVAATGGGTIDEDVRDVDIYTASLRGSYEFAPRYEAFARVSGNIRDYDDSTANGTQPNRNSNGFRVDAGATIDLTGVTYAEIFAGYLVQDYDDSTLGSIDGIDYGARVVWNPTEITSVTLNADRQVQDSNTFGLTTRGVSANSPGYLRSDVGLEVDHELLRNVLLNARASYENDDYEKIDRNDDRFDIGAGVRYSLNRNLYLGASYTFTRRDSSGAASTGAFSRNLFLVRLGAQL